MIWTLTGRHLRIFFRDRMGVFFALLSPLILFALYKLFLGNIQVNNLKDDWPAANHDDAQHFVDAWVFAGTLMLTTLTAGLGAMTVFVDDRASGRFADFVVSPIRRRDLILGYSLTSFLIALSISLFVLVASQLITVVTGASLMHPADWLRCVGSVIVMCAAFSAISGLAVTFTATSGAFSSLSAIVGTFAGFLAMAYIPAQALPHGVVRVLNWLPFAEAAMLVRGPLTSRSLAALTHGQPQAAATVRANYGISISLAGHHAAASLIAAVLAAIAIIFAAIGSWRIRRVVA
ncbi:MAG TPA: ABC transporter permease [Thermomicrobiales bacterium]|nr:ABC transporter permease [Thermomicrobiales bacterium]